MYQISAALTPVFANWLPLTTTLVSLFTIIVVLNLKRYQKHRKFQKIVDKIAGPSPLPILGNALDLNCAPEELFRRIVGWCNKWRETGPLVRFWVGWHPVVLVCSSEAVEALLSSNTHITKSSEYNYLLPWLATGLLTSTGNVNSRKIYLDVVHLLLRNNILEDFLETFHEQSTVLVDKLHTAMLQSGEDGFNILPYIKRCTLDIICDTAMGKQLDAQNHEESEYVKAVYSMAQIVQKRQARPWLQPDLLFNLTHYTTEQKHSLNVLHGFTDQVIKEKKTEYQLKMTISSNQSQPDDDQQFTRKKRLAFLDLLITASDEGKVLSDADIREEVDTFMFEGHDTVAAGIGWSLFLIGSDPEIQETVYQEIRDVLGDDLDRPITMQDMPKLKYLECCIKEALRLYPSVPLMGRELKEDLIVGEFTIPAGCTAAVFPYSVHRNPSVFPNPEAFMPERFSAENCRGRHPFAYVPFSAGPRNCIGQKFAVMEEKVVLTHVFRRFQVKSLDKREDLDIVSELVLQPKDKLTVSLTLRPVEC